MGGQAGKRAACGVAGCCDATAGYSPAADAAATTAASAAAAARCTRAGIPEHPQTAANCQLPAGLQLLTGAGVTLHAWRIVLAHIV